MFNNEKMKSRKASCKHFEGILKNYNEFLSQGRVHVLDRKNMNYTKKTLNINTNKDESRAIECKDNTQRHLPTKGCI